jgi:1-acyl-sn-glycerol-3-phosphate acyltransferase
MSTPSQGKIAGADFRPAKLHLPTLRLWYACLPLIMRQFCDVSSVEIGANDLARLKATEGKRMVITPNHPTNTDPALIFALAKASGIPFHYVACRETFDMAGGLWGRVIQRLGAYSVVRGTADRESFRATRALLASPGGKVVIFPEGEVHSQNDTLLPFHSGVVQLAFWAMEDLRKAGEPEGSVGLLPVAVRYRFAHDMSQPIEKSLQRLERTLNLPSVSKNDRYTRLRTIGIAILETLETEYGLKPDPTASSEDLTPRMDAMRNLLLDRCAQLVGAIHKADMTQPERMRALMNALYAVTREEPAEKRSPYRERIHQHQAARAIPLLKDLDRVANWIAVQDNYVRAEPSDERMADNLRRLEVEAFGASKLRGMRRAVVNVGERIDLATYSDAYKSDKRGTVAKVTLELEQAVQALLTTSAKADKS